MKCSLNFAFMDKKLFCNHSNENYKVGAVNFVLQLILTSDSG